MSTADGIAAAAKVTYDEYAAMPDEGKRFEIHDGELVEMTPGPSTRHQRVCGNLSYLLVDHLRRRDLGVVYVSPVDVILAPTTVVQPDILYLAKDRLGVVTERAIEGAPNLVIEILSRGTATRDRVAKKKLYARFGVPRYWIVDPERRTLEILSLVGSVYGSPVTHSAESVVETDVPSGFRVALREIWD